MTIPSTQVILKTTKIALDQSQVIDWMTEKCL